MKPHIKDFFKFLKQKEGKSIPLFVKLRNIKDFPLNSEDLKVKGDLHLDVDTLPDGLPDNLHVLGDLRLNEMLPGLLPNGLKVEKDLLILYSESPGVGYLTEEKVKEVIEQKGGYIKGEIKIEILHTDYDYYTDFNDDDSFNDY